MEKKEYLETIKHLSKKYDLKMINEIYRNALAAKKIDLNSITPIRIIDKTKLSKEDYLKYREIGKKIISSDQYAVITLAGGNATRLGINIPKGCFELMIGNHKKSLFELIADDFKKNYQENHVYIRWYIMTNEETDSLIKEFFLKNNYFDYPKEKIFFFKQDSLPILSKEGDLLLKDNDKLLEGPNGNGDVYLALKRNNFIKDMRENDIKWIYITGIDNILGENFDASFIGLLEEMHYKLGSKSALKENLLSKESVFCKYHNKPYILNYRFITSELYNLKDENNNYYFQHKNVLMHLIDIDLLEEFSNLNLPYNKATKQYSYLDENGNIVYNECYKFEKFVFDAFTYHDDMLIYQIDEDLEFSPIKDFNSKYNPLNAIKKYIEKQKND